MVAVAVRPRRSCASTARCPPPGQQHRVAHPAQLGTSAQALARPVGREIAPAGPDAKCATAPRSPRRGRCPSRRCGRRRVGALRAADRELLRPTPPQPRRARCDGAREYRRSRASRGRRSSRTIPGRRPPPPAPRTGWCCRRTRDKVVAGCSVAPPRRADLRDPAAVHHRHAVASVIASSWSWVTTTKVVPRRYAWIDTSSNCVSSRNLRSSAASGSSSGAVSAASRARAQARRAGARRPKAGRGCDPRAGPGPASSSISATRARDLRGRQRSCFRPKATLSRHRHVREQRVGLEHQVDRPLR